MSTTAQNLSIQFVQQIDLQQSSLGLSEDRKKFRQVCWLICTINTQPPLSDDSVGWLERKETWKSQVCTKF